MTRRSVSSLLLIVLIVLGVALAIRAGIGHDRDHGFVDFGEGWDADELRHQAFRLDQTARVAVTATGSFETASALAAYGWIVRRDDRSVVWQMTADNATRERGSLATTADTIMLDAGTYDAYFTTYGDPLLPVEEGDSFVERVSELLRFGNRAWTSDESKWRFRLNLVDDVGGIADHLHGDERDATPKDPNLVWAGGPANRSETLTHVFEVRQPATVRIEALGEIFNGPVDTGWIDDLSTGDRVWTMDETNTEWAGGSVKNRRFSGTLDLTSGLYRATYESDNSHHPGRWRANPPLDPAAYGLFLYADDSESVVAFDPWSRLPKVVEMTGVGDDALETAMFTLEAPLQAWIYAEGEMTKSSSYDHAWLIRDGEGVVWEMNYKRTRHAGGAERNRIEEASLTLAPGSYTLHMETDGTHSPDGWYSDKPEYPERWGVTLFALDENFGSVAVERRSEWGGEDRGPTPPRSMDGTLPVLLAPLRNNEDVERTFTLDEETELHIYALGEILPSGRFDYGWITNDEDHVWEMTRSNTQPGGGARKNRLFDGTITLPAGTYTVHFKTDDSHAFGRFNEGSPTDPSAWGITVKRPEVVTPPAPPTPPVVPDTTQMLSPPLNAAPNPPLSDA